MNSTMQSAQESAGGIRQRSVFKASLSTTRPDSNPPPTAAPQQPLSLLITQEVNRNNTDSESKPNWYNWSTFTPQPASPLLTEECCYLWRIIFHNPKLLVSALYWRDSEPHKGSLTAKTFALLVFYFKKRRRKTTCKASWTDEAAADKSRAANTAAL